MNMATEIATEVHPDNMHAWPPPSNAPPPPSTFHENPNASMTNASYYTNHDSILDITTTTEASDATLQRSFVSYDENEQTPLNQSMEEDAMAVVTSSPPHGAQQPCCDTTTTDSVANPIAEWTTRLIDTSSTSLRNVTESLVESLCPAEDSMLLEGACGGTYSVFEDLQNKAELDFLSLLGCVDPPSQDELVQVWPRAVVVVESKTSKRASLQERANRIKRIRQDRLHKQVAPTNGPPTSNDSFLTRTKSMDDSYMRNSSYSHHVNTSTDSLGDWLLDGGNLFDSPDDDDLGNLIGQGMDPILPLEEDVLSYDSDPEEHMSPSSCQNMDSVRGTSLFVPNEAQQEHMFYDGHRAKVAERVEQQQEQYSPVDSSLQVSFLLQWQLGVLRLLQDIPFILGSHIISMSFFYVLNRTLSIAHGLSHGIPTTKLQRRSMSGWNGAPCSTTEPPLLNPNSCGERSTSPN